MKFTKMQGAGNDFVVTDADGLQRDWAKLAIAVCDRHYGIGADGILLFASSNVADFRMRIFNADGSEAAACGNGIRCLVKYFVDRTPASSPTREVTIETMAGIRKAKAHIEAGKVVKVEVGMGRPALSIKDIPAVIDEKGKLVDINSMTAYSIDVDGTSVELNLVSMGNPHAVCFVRSPVSEFPLSRIGPRIEKHRIFPAGVNFEVARVLGSQEIEARVWERGVGETLACGSGACAIAVAARLRGYINNNVGIRNNNVGIRLPGGKLEVTWDGKGEVVLGGPAETVFHGEWPEK